MTEQAGNSVGERRGCGTVGIIIMVLGAIAVAVVAWIGWQALDYIPQWEWQEFQRTSSPDGRYTLVLEQGEPFGFGPTPVRVLFAEESQDPRPVGTMRVANDGRFLRSCGVQWDSSDVIVVCSGDEGGPETVTVPFG